MIRRAANTVGRLNAFQRVMLQWSELHPYNAIHTYKFAGPADVQALRWAVDDAFEHNGLGVAEIDLNAGCYRHLADESDDLPEIELVGGNGDADERLAANTRTELNRPFERPRCRPFRFSVVDAGPDSHYVSMIYDHWAADSIGARLVMRHVLGRYLDLDIPENESTLDLYPGTYREVFARRLLGAKLAWPMLRSIRTWFGSRTTWRVAFGSTFNMGVGYDLFKVAPGTVQRLRRFAKVHEASMNDVFLAALCLAMVPHLPKRYSKARGNAISLGTIVDTRAHANEDLSESLGTFLGYYLVRIAGDGRIGLGDLTRRIAAVTRRKKRQQSHLDSALNLRIAGSLWTRIKPESRPFFALRALPLTAGVTNVNLRGSWIEQYAAGRILDFSRTASSGPSIPFVISPTTLGDQMNVGASYRETGFSQSRVNKIMASFVEQLESVECRTESRRHAEKTQSPAACNF